MSALLNKKKRAKARESRRKRRSAILEAATHLFARQPYANVTLDAIGRRAGVSKGIASLHFTTKEELFLQVTRDELALWFEAMEDRLRESEEPLDDTALAEMLTDDLSGRTELTRLLSLLHNVLEQNVEILAAQTFLQWLKERTLSLGQTLERRCPSFRQGEGTIFLRRLAVILVGLRQTANLSGVFAAIVQDEEMAVLRADFREELHALITKIIGDRPR